MIGADLFAGAGGASLGLYGAASAIGMPIRDLCAVNHWGPAIDTHRANHPDARHYQEDIRRIDPVTATRGQTPMILLAGPDCTHHSNARGGKPRDTGQRALAWDVVRWARLTRPRRIIVENVPEFAGWGPLDADGKPDKARKGEFFAAFLDSLRALGYSIDWRILRAADHGDATTRRRLFVLGSLDGQPVWPAATHSQNADANLFGGKTWRTAREIIDWSIPGQSIFGREKPLAEKTVARIVEGIRRFAGESFIVPQLSGANARSLSEPLNTITATGTGNALVTPFLVGVGGPVGRQKVRSIDEPLGAVLGECHQYLVSPFLIPNFGEAPGQSPRVHSLDEPLPSVTGHGAGALVEPFLVSYYGNGHAHDLSQPLPTATGRDRYGLVEPIAAHDGSRWIVADVRLRMLQPHELAAAHSFPVDYQWIGSKANRVKLIGNSWPVRVAQALCAAQLTGCAEVAG